MKVTITVINRSEAAGRVHSVRLTAGDLLLLKGDQSYSEREAAAAAITMRQTLQAVGYTVLPIEYEHLSDARTGFLSGNGHA